RVGWQGDRQVAQLVAQALSEEVVRNIGPRVRHARACWPRPSLEIEPADEEVAKTRVELHPRIVRADPDLQVPQQQEPRERSGESSAVSQTVRSRRSPTPGPDHDQRDDLDRDNEQHARQGLAGYP